MTDKIACSICPFNCKLRNGDIGKCGIICNNDGSLKEIQSGSISAANIEPIEKKPLYHFYPGNQTLSVGFYGCNMTCQYCQNSKFAHARSKDIVANASWSPEYVIKIAQDKDASMICFTYTEPLIRLNYLKEIYRLAKERDIKIVVSTNGLYNSEFWKEAINYVDAINMDIKTPLVFCGDSEQFEKSEFERKVLQIDSKYMVIPDNLRIAYQRGIHVECSLLVVNETYGNEDDIFHSAINAAKSIASIGKDIPVHLLKYFPVEKLGTDSTRDSMLNAIFKEFSKHLNYVYTDFGHIDKDTVCPECKSSVISRKSYVVQMNKNMRGNKCSCGYELPIVIKGNDNAKVQI